MLGAGTVGFSRVYLGGHHLADVLAGATIGIVCSRVAALARVSLRFRAAMWTSAGGRAR